MVLSPSWVAMLLLHIPRAMGGPLQPPAPVALGGKGVEPRGRRWLCGKLLSEPLGFPGRSRSLGLRTMELKEQLAAGLGKKQDTLGGRERVIYPVTAHPC